MKEHSHPPRLKRKVKFEAQGSGELACNRMHTVQTCRTLCGVTGAGLCHPRQPTNCLDCRKRKAGATKNKRKMKSKDRDETQKAEYIRLPHDAEREIDIM